MLAQSLSNASIRLLARLHHLGDAMKTLAGLLLATLLTMSAGCAKTDWIDRTLVTVDVTGTCDRYSVGGTGGAGGSFELGFGSSNKERPSKDRWPTMGSGSGVDGTIAGDVSVGERARGDAEGELAVSGDEMMDREMFDGTLGNQRIILRRTVVLRARAAPEVIELRSITGLLVTVTLTLSAGCAQTDWIDRTLVTVDVTGTWYGYWAGGAGRETYFELKQEGNKVSGSCESSRADLEGGVYRRHRSWRSVQLTGGQMEMCRR